jgi:hypothetical protein
MASGSLLDTAAKPAGRKAECLRWTTSDPRRTHDEQHEVETVGNPPDRIHIRILVAKRGCDPLGELGERWTWPRQSSCPQERDALDRRLGLRTVVRPRVDSRSPMIGSRRTMNREPRTADLNRVGAPLLRKGARRPYEFAELVFLSSEVEIEC